MLGLVVTKGTIRPSLPGMKLENYETWRISHCPFNGKVWYKLNSDGRHFETVRTIKIFLVQKLHGLRRSLI
jgi:hypothetical protein